MNYKDKKGMSISLGDTFLVVNGKFTRRYKVIENEEGVWGAMHYCGNRMYDSDKFVKLSKFIKKHGVEIIPKNQLKLEAKKRKEEYEKTRKEFRINVTPGEHKRVVDFIESIRK